jgi:hypothetical protein
MQLRAAGDAGQFKHGQIYDVNGKQQVWDSQKGAFQDVGNAGDMGQALANWTNTSDTANRFFDWNSEYNKTLREYFQKQAEDAAPSEDDLLADQAATGMSSSGLAARRHEAASMRAREQGTQAFTGAYIQGQSLGVQAQLSHEQQRIQMSTAQNELELQKSKMKNGLLNSVIGSVLDVGVTAATGGFNKVAQAAGNMVGGDLEWLGGEKLAGEPSIGANWGQKMKSLSFADQFRNEQLRAWGG